MRVIVADDDGDIRDLVSVAVARAGLDLVAAAADGTAAWEVIQRERPDLVILDVSMPGLSGLELCGMIRSDERLADTTILLLSASVTEHSQRAGHDVGADEYLMKPFSPRELAAQLSAIAARPTPER